MDESIKKWIDEASYEQLFSHRRFAPVGDPVFQGKAGEYFNKIIAEKGEKLSNAEKVQISKSVGW